MGCSFLHAVSWSRVVLVWKCSAWLGCPFPGPAGERGLFVGHSCLDSLVSPGLPLLHTSSGRREGEKKPKELTLAGSSGLKVSGWSAFSPPFRVSLRLFYINGQGFSCTPWRNTEKRVYSIFPEVEVKIIKYNFKFFLLCECVSFWYFGHFHRLLNVLLKTVNITN